jgi:hypothetical protein
MEMKHVAEFVDRTSPLALIQCSAHTGKKKLIPGTQDFVPDLHGNLNAVLSQTGAAPMTATLRHTTGFPARLGSVRHEGQR